MKSLRINRLDLNNDPTKVAVSLVAKHLTDLNRQLSRVRQVQPDLVEWRIDALDRFPDPSTVKAGLNRIHDRIAPLPLIATFRTQSEGGSQRASEDQYFRLLGDLSNQPAVDLLDVELEHDRNRVASIVTRAHQHGIKVIMSNHDFKKVPDSSVILDRMNRMQALGADLAKVAVMPRTREDVLRFMRTSLVADQNLRIPVVTMAMGDLGKLTRIAGALTGSVISFGSMDSHVSSAPGQITVPTLRRLLRLFSK